MEFLDKLLHTRHRTSLYVAITVLLVLAAGVSALSSHDPGGEWPRVGLVFMAIAAAMWLPRQSLAPGVVLIWLITTIARSLVAGGNIITPRNLLELVVLLALAAAGYMTRISLRRLEEGNEVDVDPETGVQAERFLLDTIEKEIARSRRFDRQFSVMIVGIDPRRLRFDYREDESWQAAFQATGALLANTRANIDRVFRYGEKSFALVLPETGPNEVTGMIRRLNRLAKSSVPGEGEPGGPLPTHIGVTFYPQAATAAEDLVRRAEVAARLAERSATRVKYDGAEAPDLPAPELLRKSPGDDQPDGEDVLAQAITRAMTTDGGPGQRQRNSSPMWLGSYVDDGDVAPSGLAATSEAGPGALVADKEMPARGPDVKAPDGEARGGATAVAPGSEGPLVGAVAHLLEGLDDALSLIQELKSA